MSDTHTREARRRSFERTAELYERYRPTYPEALFEDVRFYADVAPDDPILEIGAGTGRATIHLARWGNPIVAIEPAPAMADIARENVRAHPHVEVRTTTFEGAELERNAFGLVAATQSFHWLDADTRVQRIHDVLYAYGTAAIIHNHQYVTDETLPFFERVQDVYLTHAPDLAHQGAFARRSDRPEHALAGSPLFTDLRMSERPWEWTLSSDDYVGLMSTHSPHAALRADVRDRLLAGIAEVIDGEFGGTVIEHYVTFAALARRA
jgi:SAM-dependent methyltransferase